MKRCSKCKQEKSESEFYRQTNGKLRSWCRTCIVKGTARYRKQRAPQDTVTVTQKRCPRCELTLPASEFPINRRRATGLADYCRSCSYQTHSAYIKTHPHVARKRREQFYSRQAQRIVELKTRPAMRTTTFYAEQEDQIYRFNTRKERDMWVMAGDFRHVVDSRSSSVRHAYQAALVGKYQWPDPNAEQQE